MKKTEKAILIEGLRKLIADATELADALERKAAPAPAEEPTIEPVTEPTPEEAPIQETPAPEAPSVTFEEARAALADKARNGYKAEVKSLLTAHGVEKLSDITDPAELAIVVQEAKEIGNG